MAAVAAFFLGRVGVHAGEFEYDRHVCGGLQGGIEEEEDDAEEDDVEDMRSFTAASGSISGGGGGGAGVPLWWWWLWLCPTLGGPF